MRQVVSCGQRLALAEASISISISCQRKTPKQLLINIFVTLCTFHCLYIMILSSAAGWM